MFWFLINIEKLTSLLLSSEHVSTIQGLMLSSYIELCVEMNKDKNDHSQSDHEVLVCLND